MITCRKYAEVGPLIGRHYEIRCGRGRFTGDWRLYTRLTPHAYVVYSYGEHWPLWVGLFEESIYQGMCRVIPTATFSNTDNRSRTTSGHARIVAGNTLYGRVHHYCSVDIIRDLARAAVNMWPATTSVRELIELFAARIYEERELEMYEEKMRYLDSKTVQAMTSAGREQTQIISFMNNVIDAHHIQMGAFDA